jgi:hypothetical protein
LSTNNSGSGPLDSLLSSNNISDDLTGAQLAELTHLEGKELESFKQAFTVMSASQRLNIIGRLVELAENNVELNFDGIFKLCLNDSDPEVRSLGVEGLWENEETSLITPLLNLLTKDDSEKVRAIAATALGRFVLLGEHGKLRPFHLDRISSSLLGTIRNVQLSEEVRRRALEAVSPLNTPEVHSEISAAYNDLNPRLRISSVYAMGRNCDTVWLPIIENELTNIDPEMRFEAATALGELGDESAAASLIKMGSDSDTEVQMAVIQALGKIGGMKAKEFLQNLLGSRDAAIRDIARQSLDELQANEDPLSLKL